VSDKKDDMPKTITKKYLLNMLWLLFIPGTLLSTFFAQNNPGFTESAYSEAVYPVVSMLLPFQYLPFFSFFEALLLAGPVVLIIYFVRFIMRLVRIKEDRTWRVLSLAQRVGIVLAVGMFLFYLLWGYNYYRQPYSVIAALPDVRITSSELYALCDELVKDTNDARSKLPSKSDGTLATGPSVSELQVMGRLAYEKALSDGVPGVIGVKGYAKPLLSSRIFSYMGISGVYFPYTGESNFNNDIPDPSRGSVVCHEIAHRQGFAREDEANFLSYLICVNSDDDYLRYSGYFLALEHAMSRLSRADRAAYIELRSLYSAEVASDINTKQAYWRMFEGRVEERVTQLNDDYLRAQNQIDGVESYGRMVDLMIMLRNK